MISKYIYVYSQGTIKKIELFFCLSMSMITFAIFMTIASFRTKQWEKNLRKARRDDLFYREVDRDRDLEGKKKRLFLKKYDGDLPSMTSTTWSMFWTSMWSWSWSCSRKKNSNLCIKVNYNKMIFFNADLSCLVKALSTTHI